MKSYSKNSTNSIFYFPFSRFLLLLILFSIFYFLFSSQGVRAAQFELSAKANTIGVKQTFELSVFLNTEKEQINAVQGNIVFPADALILKEIRDGNSLVNLWVERPRSISQNEIFFSGITPGGYNGDKGLLFSLVYEAKQEMKGSVVFREASALLNDGKGTNAKIKTSDFAFSISKKPSVDNLTSEIRDTQPPEPFTPNVARDPNIFQGQWFLVFATQDKDSGIAHYEVKENGDSFVVAESPHLLKYQSLDAEIAVKAVDKAGNTRVAVLTAPQPKPIPRYIPRYERYLIWIILFILLAPLLFFVRKRAGKRRK